MMFNHDPLGKTTRTPPPAHPLERTFQTIYRVQNAAGHGPYRAGFSILDEHEHRSLSHPTPYNDEMIQRWMEHDELCGFLSVEILKEWFTEKQLDVLAQAGYTVVQLQGFVTAVGKKQVLFRLIGMDNVA